MPLDRAAVAQRHSVAGRCADVWTRQVRSGWVRHGAVLVGRGLAWQVRHGMVGTRCGRVGLGQVGQAGHGAVMFAVAWRGYVRQVWVSNGASGHRMVQCVSVGQVGYAWVGQGAAPTGIVGCGQAGQVSPGGERQGMAWQDVSRCHAGRQGTFGQGLAGQAQHGEEGYCTVGCGRLGLLCYETVRLHEARRGQVWHGRLSIVRMRSSRLGKDRLGALRLGRSGQAGFARFSVAWLGGSVRSVASGSVMVSQFSVRFGGSGMARASYVSVLQGLARCGSCGLEGLGTARYVPACRGKARQDKVGSGWGEFCSGGAWCGKVRQVSLGKVQCVEARSGAVRQVGFGPGWLGEVRHGSAGKARSRCALLGWVCQGEVGPDVDWYVSSRHLFGLLWQVRSSWDRLGGVMLGLARQVWPVTFRTGLSSVGMSSCGTAGLVGLGAVSQGLVRHGAAGMEGRDKVWRGTAGDVRHVAARVSTVGSGLAGKLRSGKLRWGMARHVLAGLVLFARDSHGLFRLFTVGYGRLGVFRTGWVRRGSAGMARLARGRFGSFSCALVRQVRSGGAWPGMVRQATSGCVADWCGTAGTGRSVRARCHRAGFGPVWTDMAGAVPVGCGVAAQSYDEARWGLAGSARYLMASFGTPRLGNARRGRAGLLRLGVGVGCFGSSRLGGVGFGRSGGVRCVVLYLGRVWRGVAGSVWRGMLWSCPLWLGKFRPGMAGPVGCVFVGQGIRAVQVGRVRSCEAGWLSCVSLGCGRLWCGAAGLARLGSHRFGMAGRSRCGSSRCGVAGAERLGSSRQSTGSAGQCKVRQGLARQVQWGLGLHWHGWARVARSGPAGRVSPVKVRPGLVRCGVAGPFGYCMKRRGVANHGIGAASCGPARQVRNGEVGFEGVRYDAAVVDWSGVSRHVSVRCGKARQVGSGLLGFGSHWFSIASHVQAWCGRFGGAGRCGARSGMAGSVLLCMVGSVRTRYILVRQGRPGLVGSGSDSFVASWCVMAGFVPARWIRARFTIARLGSAGAAQCRWVVQGRARQGSLGCAVVGQAWCGKLRSGPVGHVGIKHGTVWWGRAVGYGALWTGSVGSGPIRCGWVWQAPAGQRLDWCGVSLYGTAVPSRSGCYGESRYVLAGEARHVLERHGMAGPARCVVSTRGLVRHHSLGYGVSVADSLGGARHGSCEVPVRSGSARQLRVGAVGPGMALLGAFGHGYGAVRQVGWGLACSGRMSVRQGSVGQFGSGCVWYASRVLAELGVAWCGSHGQACPGIPWLGVGLVRCGMVGQAWRVSSCQDGVCSGAVRRGMAGPVRTVPARLCIARYGSAGSVRRGKVRMVGSGMAGPFRFSMLRWGIVGLGVSWCGWVWQVRQGVFGSGKAGHSLGPSSFGWVRQESFGKDVRVWPGSVRVGVVRSGRHGAMRCGRVTPGAVRFGTAGPERSARRGGAWQRRARQAGLGPVWGGSSRCGAANSRDLQVKTNRDFSILPLCWGRRGGTMWGPTHLAHRSQP